jgi:hypothetical protein
MSKGDLLEQPSLHEQEEYFRRILKELQLEGIVSVGKSKVCPGKGIFAERDFKPHQLIFQEKPLVSVQDCTNRMSTQVCSYCHNFIGSLEDQIRLLAGYEKNPTLPFVEECFYNPPQKPADPELKSIPFNINDYLVPNIVHCSNGCEAMYCSAKCEETAMFEYHKILCPGEDKEHAYHLFEQFSEEQNDGFLLAARMLAKIIQEAERNDGNIKKACEPFAMFVTDYWWNLVPPFAPNLPEWKDDLKEILTSNLDILRIVLAEYVNKYPEVFTIEFYGKLCGVIDMNCVEMIVTSPVPEYFYNIEKLSEDKKSIAEPITEKILDDIEKHEEELEMMDSHLCGDEECEDDHEHDVEGHAGHHHKHDHKHRHRGEKEEKTHDERETDAEYEGDSHDSDAAEEDKEEFEDKEGDKSGDEDEDAYSFPNCQGISLCSIQGTMNHSCRPNAEVFKRNKDRHGNTVVYCRTPIKKGDEIFISYIELDEPLEERRDRLQLPYLFTCNCERCVEEEKKQSGNNSNNNNN